MTDEEMIEAIKGANIEFEEVTSARLVLGEQKYGVGAWIEIDNIQHAMDEVADLANYARFAWIKLRILQQRLAAFGHDGSIATPLPGQEMLGKNSVFNPYKSKEPS